jgi:ribosomal protein L37AE/L43A
MTTPTRMPRHEVRNDGAGPYAIFYCDKCDREFRSQPQIAATIAKDVGRKALGGLLGGIPIVGSIADRALEDQRYVYDLTPQQLEAAWKEVQVNFHECPTCRLIVCPSDFDAQSGFCTEDSPRRGEIAQAQAQQAAGVLKGIADVFGVGDAIRGVAQAARSATANTARCPKDGTLAAAGTKFCPECGSPMVQPVSDRCPKCGAEAQGAKFCPECGTKIERAAAAPTTCPSCGKETKGAKFCPECGTKVG